VKSSPLQWLYANGLGFYHSGVEIKDLNSASTSSNVEFSFSRFGIQRSRPRLPEFGRLRIQIDMGTFDGTMQDINVIINRLSADNMQGKNYDVLSLNCNNFSERFCQELVGQSIPAWVNRAASIGSTFQGQIQSFPAMPAPGVPSTAADSAGTRSGASASGVGSNAPPTRGSSGGAGGGAAGSGGGGEASSSGGSIFSFLFGGWGGSSATSSASSSASAAAAVETTKATPSAAAAANNTNPMKKKELTDKQKELLSKLKSKT
jgi:deubiquitinase DESI2